MACRQAIWMKALIAPSQTSPWIAPQTALQIAAHQKVSCRRHLPGIRGLHDFLALRNSGRDTVMKVRDSCYTGTLKDTPMKITKGMSASDRAIPGVNQSYFALGMVKQLSESKQSRLNQMYANFIPHDRWHELANH